MILATLTRYWVDNTHIDYDFTTYRIHAGLIDGRSGRDTLEVCLDGISDHLSGIGCRISISVIRINFRTSV